MQYPRSGLEVFVAVLFQHLVKNYIEIVLEIAVFYMIDLNLTICLCARLSSIYPFIHQSIQRISQTVCYGIMYRDSIPIAF